MTFFTTICLAFALLVALNEASKIKITSNHSIFKPGVTTNLDITCIVENTGVQDFAKIFDLQVKRDDEIVALFNTSVPIELDVVSKPYVSGDLTGTSGDKAYIQVSYKNPPAELAGTYVCTALGEDSLGRKRFIDIIIHTIEGSLQISAV